VGEEWTDGGEEAVGPLLSLSLMSTTAAVGTRFPFCVVLLKITNFEFVTHFLTHTQK
jgi:hypothetical protein